MRYPTRNHAFAPPVTWVIEEPWLRVEEERTPAVPPRMIALGDIVQVRLEYAPTRPERNRFRCRLTLRTGETLEFFNRRYRGVYQFEETSADYVRFVRGLHDALAAGEALAPGRRYCAGSGAAAYAANVLATGFVFLCFGAIAWFLARVNLTWMIGIKILLILFYLPALLRWVARNRPRMYRPEAIPSDLLPAVTSDGVAAPKSPK
jgi:hypothetical protein